MLAASSMQVPLAPTPTAMAMRMLMALTPMAMAMRMPMTAPMVRSTRPTFGSLRRFAVALPQLPGLVFANAEIPGDALIDQVRAWESASPALSRGGFDLLQVAEAVEGAVDGRMTPRATCGLWRTRLLLAHHPEPVPVLVALFYRSRDPLNREFWEDQARRLCDIVAEEHFGHGSGLGGRAGAFTVSGKAAVGGEDLRGNAGQSGGATAGGDGPRSSSKGVDQSAASGRGLLLLVHHGAAPWSLGLEVGDHRLIAQLKAVNLFFSPWRRPSLPRCTAVLGPLSLAGGSSSSPGLRGALSAFGGPDFSDYHELLEPMSCDGAAHGDGCVAQPTASREGAGKSLSILGHYVLRGGGAERSEPRCGVSVVGTSSWRLVCAGAWAREGFEADVFALLDALRRRSRALSCCLLADGTDPRFLRLLGPLVAAPRGVWCSVARPFSVALTGVPFGLSEAEQESLARSPFLVPWEFVPFHAGRLLLL